MYTINTIPHVKCFVRYLPTRCFCIRNLTRSLRSLVRFLIQKQLVCKYRTPALSMKYSLYISKTSDGRQKVKSPIVWDFPDILLALILKRKNILTDNRVKRHHTGIQFNFSFPVSGIECPVCTNVPGIGAGKCDSGKVPKVTCPDGWNQCMSLKGKMTVLGITQSIELKNCSNNIWCDSASDYNGKNSKEFAPNQSINKTLFCRGNSIRQ